MKKLIKSSILLAVFSFACVGNGQAFWNKAMPGTWYRFNKKYFFNAVAKGQFAIKDLSYFDNLYFIKTAAEITEIKIKDQAKWNKIAEKANEILSTMAEIRINNKFPLFNKINTPMRIKAKKITLWFIRRCPDNTPAKSSTEGNVQKIKIECPKFKGTITFDKDRSRQMTPYDLFKSRLVLPPWPFKKFAEKIGQFTITTFEETENLFDSVKKKRLKTVGAIKQHLQREISDLEKLVPTKQQIKVIKAQIKPLKKQYFKTIIELIKLL